MQLDGQHLCGGDLVPGRVVHQALLEDVGLHCGIGPGGEDIQDEPNACVRGLCYPGCTSDTQCAVYAGTFCQVVTDVGNTQVQICSAGPDAGMP